MTPAKFREWTGALRDATCLIVGLFLWVYLPLSGQFTYWQAPFLIGLVGAPFIARGEPKVEPAPAGVEDAA